MDNHEAIASLKTLCHTCKLFPRCAYEKPECFQSIEMAISALQEQDSKTRKVCNMCKHDPPSKKKFPCVDCDMREPADRWEPKDVPGTNVSDTVSRQAAIDATWFEPNYTDPLNVLTEVRDRLEALPPAQPEIIHCRDCKHHHYESKGIPYCDRTDYGYGWKDDDFCSRGERRNR